MTEKLTHYGPATALVNDEEIAARAKSTAQFDKSQPAGESIGIERNAQTYIQDS